MRNRCRVRCPSDELTGRVECPVRWHDRPSRCDLPCYADAGSLDPADPPSFAVVDFAFLSRSASSGTRITTLVLLNLPSMPRNFLIPARDRESTHDVIQQNLVYPRNMQSIGEKQSDRLALTCRLNQSNTFTTHGEMPFPDRSSPARIRPQADHRQRHSSPSIRGDDAASPALPPWST